MIKLNVKEIVGINVGDKMKEILDYISNNSFLTTIIGVIIGGLMSSLTSIYVSSKERKDRKKEEQDKEKLRQFENKAELKIEEVLEESNNKADIEVFLLPFKVDYTDGFKNYKFIYPEGIDNKKMHKYKEFHIKNIGNSDINQLDICAIFKNHNILVDYNGLDDVIENGVVNYNLCYDRKIMKSHNIIIRVYYLEGYQVCHPFSCTLAILYKDSFNNLYEQAFWYEKDNLYEPIAIDYKKYKETISSESAYNCFENPNLW